MTARERILVLRLLEKQEQNPEYAKRIGIRVWITANNPKERKNHNV